MKLAKLFTLTCVSVLPFAANAAITVSIFAVDSLDGLYLTPEETSLDASYSLAWGSLSVTFTEFTEMSPQEQATYLSNLDTNFTSYGQEQFSASGTINAFPSYDGPAPAGSTTGEQLYTLITDTLGNYVGLFTSQNTTNWQMPADGGSIQMYLSAGTVTALLGSVNGNNAILANAVPEPSTYAFVAGLMTLGLVAYRRRQKA